MRTLSHLGLLFAVFAGVGCAGRDLKVLCSAAEEALHDSSVPPDERATRFAEKVDRGLSRFGDIRKAVQAVAVADPNQKYELLKAAAAEVGYPEWDCPALKELLAPSPSAPPVEKRL